MLAVHVALCGWQHGIHDTRCTHSLPVSDGQSPSSNSFQTQLYAARVLCCFAGPSAPNPASLASPDDIIHIIKDLPYLDAGGCGCFRLVESALSPHTKGYHTPKAHSPSIDPWMQTSIPLRLPQGLTLALRHMLMSSALVEAPG